MDVPHRPSEVYRFRPNFTWDGVEVRQYKPEEGGWDGIVRQVIAGWGHQTAFHVRYFEIAPGGYSSLEKHGHAHVVIGLRGKGHAVVGARAVALTPFDVLYLRPWEPHQFVNNGDEPFGFLCVVDAERDRPQPLSEDELVALRQSNQTAVIARFGEPKLVRHEEP